ncbi:MAG: cysteine desulfurase-like protein [Thermogutta sp.]|nr:cysteine desulfurase-like protein [Thermogutta sp.]
MDRDSSLPRPLDVWECRRQFPALSKRENGLPVMFFDAAAGTQVPHDVLDAVVRYLVETNANHGGMFATSRESDALLFSARTALADFLGADDPDTIVFGANMTTLTFAFSRALARTWKPGDEILLTRMEHDANFTPWIRAAEEAGVQVQIANIRPEEGTLDLEDFVHKLTPRTRLVAVTAASNAIGTLTPIPEIVRQAHAAGALVFLDAVHYAPHRCIDVVGWDIDFLVCSGYKFFAPHVGILWGKRRFLESLPAYKVRPAPNGLPDRWMTGTQNHEGIAGAAAAVEYLAEIGRRSDPRATGRRAALQAAFQAVAQHEHGLVAALLQDLADCPGIRVWGIPVADADRRVPTVSITHRRLPARELAEYLAARSIFTWHGNFHALPLTEVLGAEPDGLLRISMVHYNTHEEVARLISALRELGP